MFDNVGIRWFGSFDKIKFDDLAIDNLGFDNVEFDETGLHASYNP